MQNKVRAHHDAPLLLTITKAAEFLKVSPDTLRRWEDKGIVTPQRTKGGSRRYTLLDLKIAKLNKNKTRLFHLSSLLKQNYINHKRDLKIALFTSFLWIFGLLTFHFLTPIFLQPTNPEQQISSEQLKEQSHLAMVSETMPVKINTISAVVSTESDLLIRRSGDLPTLQYTDSTDPYYSISYLNKKNLTL